MNRKVLVPVIAVLALLSFAAWAAAQGPVPEQPLEAQASVGSSFTYQGQLKQDGGVVDGSCDFQFRLYNAASGGSQIGSAQTVTGLGVQEGFFTANLDFGGGAFDGAARWLSVSVRCPAGSGSYTTLSPRQALSATPYALSLRPDAVVSNPATSSDGNNPTTAITGRATAVNGYAHGLLGDAYSPDGQGVSGNNYSTNGGIGVYGWSGATTGFARGVSGESHSPDGAGVFGWNDNGGDGVLGIVEGPESAGGAGVAGLNFGTTGFANGVWGDTDSPDGAGVVGYSDGGGDGVAGYVDGLEAASAVGVYGFNHATTGESKGVMGESQSPDGVGVFGWNDDGGDGVVGISTHDGSGVHGASYSETSFAVSGSNYAETGWGIGVYGDTSSDGPAVAANNSDTGIGLWARSAHGSLIEAVGNDLYDIEFWVSNDGDVYADGAFQSPAADFAELLPAQPGLEPGDVLAIGPDGKLTRTAEPYQTTVVGVYSSQPAFLGNSAGEEQSGRAPLALIGVVPVKVSTENGPIQPGDVLVASGTAGHAMRTEPVVVNGITFYPSGVVIGKALGSLDEGTGVIDVLVMLQ